MLDRCWRRLDGILKAIMAILLFAMMAITTVDVFGRYVFGIPIPGGFELVQYLMALVVFASIPVTTAADSHLTVALITPRRTGLLGFSHRLFIRALSMIALAVITWRMADQALILRDSQQISGYLQLPLAPIAFTMAGLAAIAFLVIVGKFVLVLRGREDSQDQPTTQSPQVD